MKWLFTIDTENDLIVFCRLMNIFRRKSVNVSRMSMAALSGTYRVLALLEGRGDEVEHIFHFVRRTEGVNQVAYYGESGTGEVSFVLVNGEAGSLNVARWMELLPGASLVFASHGKALLETPAGSAWQTTASGLPDAGCLRLSCVKKSHTGAGVSGESLVA
ncbi:MAG: hypothetical protein ACRD3O_15230 [Terriglobia bacterium]